MEREALSAVWSTGDAGRPALVSPDDGVALGRGELAERVDAHARELSGLGVERGDRVALALPNGPELVELLLALGALGAAAAPLNPAYTADEFAFFLGDLAASCPARPRGRGGGRASRRGRRGAVRRRRR